MATLTKPGWYREFMQKSRKQQIKVSADYLKRMAAAYDDAIVQMENIILSTKSDFNLA